jgi:hypothetical protein
MGWYAANDDSARSKGTLYFLLHRHGAGHWVGLSYIGCRSHRVGRDGPDRRRGPRSDRGLKAQDHVQSG